MRVFEGLKMMLFSNGDGGRKQVGVVEYMEPYTQINGRIPFCRSLSIMVLCSINMGIKI